VQQLGAALLVICTSRNVAAIAAHIAAVFAAKSSIASSLFVVGTLIALTRRRACTAGNEFFTRLVGSFLRAAAAGSV
jgi:hypothetical protein